MTLTLYCIIIILCFLLGKIFTLFFSSDNMLIIKKIIPVHPTQGKSFTRTRVCHNGMKAPREIIFLSTFFGKNKHKNIVLEQTYGHFVSLCSNSVIFQIFFIIFHLYFLLSCSVWNLRKQLLWLWNSDSAFAWEIHCTCMAACIISTLLPSILFQATLHKNDICTNK